MRAQLTYGSLRFAHDRLAAEPFRELQFTLAAREDVAALAEIDALHDTLSGPATRKLCERAVELFGDERYTRQQGATA